MTKWKKAHPEVFNILLQVFDDGRITDSKGRIINCKNALFIMTSNLGSDLILKELEEKKEMSTKQVLAILNPVLQKHFRPEFLNRIDDIVPFHPLRPEDMGQIAALQLQSVQKRLKEQKIELDWNEKAISYLVEKGYDPIFGARPLKRLIQKEVVNPFSNLIIQKQITPDVKLHLTSEDKQLHIDLEPIKQEKKALASK